MSEPTPTAVVEEQPVRRPLDVFALVVGLLAVAISVLALVGQSADVHVDGVVVFAVVWIVVGVVAVARAVQRLITSARD